MFERDRYVAMPEPRKLGYWLIWDTAIEKVVGRFRSYSWDLTDWHGEEFSPRPTQDDLRWLADEWTYGRPR